MRENGTSPGFQLRSSKPCLCIRVLCSVKIYCNKRSDPQVDNTLREKSLASFLRLWFSSINQCH